MQSLEVSLLYSILLMGENKNLFALTMDLGIGLHKAVQKFLKTHSIFRVQSTIKVRLREYAAQKKLGRT